MTVTSFRDLMAGHPSAEIRCLYTGNLVRKLTTVSYPGNGPYPGSKAEVAIDALSGPVVTVPADTPIRLEPWVFDRGNMLFAASAVINPPAEIKNRLAADPAWELKICGEGDTVVFPDGTRDHVSPAG